MRAYRLRPSLPWRGAGAGTSTPTSGPAARAAAANGLPIATARPGVAPSSPTRPAPGPSVADPDPPASGDGTRVGRGGRPTGPGTPTDGADGPPSGNGRRPSRPGRRTSLRPLVLRVHFYAGILVAPLLVVACVTGLLYTFTPQVEAIVHRHELHASVAPGARPIPVIDQVRAARAAHPEGTIASVRPADALDHTTRVNLEVPGLQEGDQRTVFVAPTTGEVRGALTTTGGWLPVRAWLDELHRTLHAGDVGRLYSETAASWLWVVVLGGLYLWAVSRRRRRTTGGTARPTGRRRTVRWHRTVGVVAAVGLLGLSATGMTWSKYAGQHVSDLQAKVSWDTPQVDAGAGEADAHAGHAGHGGDTAGAATSVADEHQRLSAIDDAIHAAGTRGLVEPLEVTPPATDGAGWTVKEIRRTWPERQDAVAVNATGTTVTDVVRFADWPIGAKLTRWGIDAHMGLLFGIFNQVALAALAIGLLVLIVLGYRMWWQRRPKQAARLRPGKPIPRGAWRSLPWAVLVPGVVVVAFVGWFAPLLGITLVAFLVLDGAVAGVRRLRARGATS